MKHEIHPDYQICTVTCGCGNTFTTRSTQPKIAIEICSKCHPFFTGKQKFVDTAGMVEKFQKKYASAAYTDAKVAKVRKVSDKASAPKLPLALAPGNPTAPPPVPGQTRNTRGGFSWAGRQGPPAAKDGAKTAKPAPKSDKSAPPAQSKTAAAAPPKAEKPAPPPADPKPSSPS